MYVPMFSKRLPGCGMKITHKSNSTEVTKKHSRPARRCFIEYRWNNRSSTSFGSETSDEMAATVDVVVVVDCFASLVVGPSAGASLSLPQPPPSPPSLSSFAFVSAAQPFTVFFSPFAFILDIRLSRARLTQLHSHSLYSLVVRCWFLFIICRNANTLTVAHTHITKIHLHGRWYFWGQFQFLSLGNFLLCFCLICSILFFEVCAT